MSTMYLRCFNLMIYNLCYNLYKNMVSLIITIILNYTSIQLDYEGIKNIIILFVDALGLN